jgi:rhamnulokinase
MLGRLERGRLILEEIHRFPNSMIKRDGTLCWDAGALLAEVREGISRCESKKIIPVSTGIDTWGVDFILLDPQDVTLGPAAAYRDSRTDGMDAHAERFVPYPDHYARTGIQKQLYNTVYQLMALKVQQPELLSRAGCMLLTPDWLRFCLTGEKTAEYTIASTTGLLNAVTRDWDWELIDMLELPRNIFLPIKHGASPSHDTAAAFLSVTAENTAIISSGTWSLLGVLSDAPILSDAARDAKFSNEGGFGGKVRFLKNIMGLWMIQEIRNELPDKVSFDTLADYARQSSYNGIVEVNGDAFFAPESMSRAVARKCADAGFPPPVSIGDTLRCVFCSLAAEYAKSVRELETLTGRAFTSISIIGGGSQNDFLNQLTASASGLPVYAGPAEGTAIGSIIAQMLISGELPDLRSAADVIRRSFEIKEFLP